MDSPKTPKQKVEQYLDLGHTEVENHAKAQQKVYEAHVSRTSSATRVISEFFSTNVFGFVYHYLRSRFGRRHPYQSYPIGGDNGIYKLAPSIPSREGISLALLSDWGSDTTESDAVAHLVARYAPDYSIHLGDIYFVGTPREVAENFTAPHASWYYGASGSLALCGNHEMYSNGSAYYKHLLPVMYAKEDGVKKTQQAAFFCLENEYWRIIGLDTGYTSVGRPFQEVIHRPDCRLRDEQTTWLRDVVKLGNPNDKRGIVFMSHHPYISAFREDYFKPGEQLCELLGDAARPVVWFWGHDHRLVGYHLGQNKSELQAYGRCIGHGGMPVETKMSVRDADVLKMAFYDRRVRNRIGRHDLGYNGFVLLNLVGEQLTATYRDLEDTEVLRESWTLDAENGELTHDFDFRHPDMSVFE